MSRRTVASLTIFCLGTWLAASAQSEKETDHMNPAHARAKTKITVQSSEAKPYEITNPKLVEIHISEKFLGDIDGESSVRALQVQRDDKSASMVSMQRFTGKLGGRHGAFVLQVKKLWRTARSRRHGLSFQDRGQVVLPGCEARAALKVTLEKGRTDGWIIGSKKT
jgi:hypothetical protein